MSINLQLPDVTDLKPRIIVVGVGGAGGNAVNNMISAGLDGVDFVVANTDAQALSASSAEHCIQLGAELTEGLGAGSRPEIGQAAAEEAIDDLKAQLAGAHMIFVAAGMGGGTGTGAAAVIARAAQELGILTVGVVTKPFQFEGNRRMRSAEAGIAELRRHVDTLIVIPNQNLFRIANKKTTFAEAFVLADQVLHSGISCITDLIVRDGLINLDFADVRAIMLNMGSAMMGTGEASGERRAVEAAEQAIFNPLLDDVSLKGAKGLLISVSGNKDLTLYEVDEAASRVRDEVDPDANIIVGATFDESLSDTVRVSIVASGVGSAEMRGPQYQHPGQSNHAIDQRGRDISDRLSAAIGTPPQAVNAAPMAAGPDRNTPEPVSKAQNGEPRQPIGTQPGQARSARPLQSGNGISDDVTIELGPPAMVRRGAAAPRPGNPPVGRPLDPASAATKGPANFQPAPPAPIAREPNRIPDVGEFPLVGQRDYHAKKQQHSKDSADGEKGLRSSLLRRLTGRGRNESDSLEDSNFDSGNQQRRQNDIATASEGTGSKAPQPSAPSNHRNGPQAAEGSTGQDRPDSGQGIEFPMVLRDGTQRS